MDIDGVLTFDAVPGGTCMRWDWQLRPKGSLRVMSPLIELIGRKQEETICTGLKNLLESTDTATPANQADPPM